MARLVSHTIRYSTIIRRRQVFFLILFPDISLDHKKYLLKSFIWIPELARLSGISTANLNLLENKKVDIGKKRAEQLAKAINVHPATIMFPEYGAKEIGKAA